MNISSSLSGIADSISSRSSFFGSQNKFFFPPKADVDIATATDRRRGVNSDNYFRRLPSGDSFKRPASSSWEASIPFYARIGTMNLRKVRAARQRAADVSSAEPSFFCRQDAGSTLRFMESFNLQDRTPIVAMNRKGAAASAPVLDSGDGVFEVAALGRASCVDGALRDLERCHSKAVTSQTPSPQSKTWRQI